MKQLLLTIAVAFALTLPAVAQEAAPAEPVTAPVESAEDKDIAESAAELSAEVEDDKGFITRFLERNLSGAGRQVVISGFQGALSSRATFTEMTIADADGVWITLRNGAIQWDRSALFGRRIEINELSAEEIILPRLPGGGGEGKSPEVKDFALPTLPVAVNIARIAAQRVEIGEPVIGEAAVVALDGSMNLAGGEGTTKLSVNRVDNKRGVFAVDAAYSNETTVLKLDVALDEDSHGLFANIVQLYDRPAVKAEIKGEGPLRDFAANIRLATDGVDRVTGIASLRAEAAEDGTPGNAFRLEMMGDVASLLPPDNRPFFGTNSKLLAEGWRGQNGRMSIPALLIDTEALNLTGSVTTNDKGAPQSLVLLMTLGEDAGATTLPVRLPFGGATDVRSGSLQISYDAAQSDAWTVSGRVGDIEHAGNRIGALNLNGNGTVELTDGELDQVLGKLGFGAEGLALKDPGLQAALGDAITGETGFDLTPGNALELSDFTLGGEDFGLYGTILADGLQSGITFSGELDAAYERLDRLSTLAGRPLTGQADAHITGLFTALTGGFDAEATINGTDITVDQEQADRLLSGESTIFASVRRDDVGIEVRDLTVNAQRLTAEARGLISSTSTDLRADLRLSSLTDADPSMSGELVAEAAVTGATGARRVTVSGEAMDLKLGIEALDAALEGRTNLTAIAQEKDGGFVVDTLRLANPQLTADGKGSFASGALDAALELDVPNIGEIAEGMAGSLKATATATEKDGVRFINATGTGENLRLGQADVDGALTGTTDFVLNAEQAGEVITLRDLRLTNDQMNATAQGVLGNGHTDLTAHADIRSLAAFGRGWRGAISADGSLKDDGTGTRVLTVDGVGRDISLGVAQADAALAGETRLSIRGSEANGVLTLTEAVVDNARLHANATGTVGGGQTDVTADLRADSLAFLGNGFGGSVNANARLRDQNGQLHLTADGTANSLRVGNEQADRVLAGQTRFDVAGARAQNGALTLERLNAQNGQLRIAASGSPEALNVDGALSDLALVVPGLPGPATLTGTVRQGPSAFDINLNATAPGGTRATIAGTAARNFSTADIRLSGVSNAALVNPMLRVRSVEGPVDFDLRLNGAPALENITGQVNLPNARLADPKLGLRVENLSGTAAFNSGIIQVDATGEIAAGGRLTVAGPIDLRNGTQLDLTARLNGVVLRDPNLYETVVDGEVSVSGDPAMGPMISGVINLGETEIRIPSTGAAGAAIPDIVHLKDRPVVRATRAKAGLLPFPSADSRIAGMNAPPATPPVNPARFDLTINAPNQVFVRGRGIDAELGGQLRLTGNARNMIPVGQLELIRGRVDLLGRRFDLTEGLIEMQGSMVPVLRLVAQTEQDEITTRIIVDGDLRDPEISFESSPELPEEEVLSQLLFGRGLQTLSPLQAAQLANAVATLAGRGGDGIVSNLRDSVGLDDLDLQTDDEGNVSVRAGKYLSRNLYTDVAVDAEGKSRINLNLDVNDAITARGSVASDGESTLGVFYERDY